MTKAMNEMQKTIVLFLPFPLHIHAQYFSPLAFSSAIVKGIHASWDLPSINEQSV